MFHSLMHLLNFHVFCFFSWLSFSREILEVLSGSMLMASQLILELFHGELVVPMGKHHFFIQSSNFSEKNSS